MRRLTFLIVAVVLLAATTIVAEARVAPPSAAFTFSPSAPVTGQSVHFDGSASRCPATPCTYSYVDGATQISTARSFDYAFSTAATHPITLTVRDRRRRVSTVEHDVVVSSQPPPPAAPANTTPPTISGTPQQGQTLIASHGTWSGTTPIAYSYQWQDCTTTSCQNIAGATSSSYKLQSSDVGSSVDVTVTGTNSAGSSSASSAQTATVTASTPPSMAGVHVNGSQLLDGNSNSLRLQGFVRNGMDYACQQGFGFTDGPSGSSEFQPMTTWNANTVVLLLNEDCWLGINGMPAAYSGQNYINFVKSEVASAEANGITPTLAFFAGDPGSDVPNFNDGSNAQPPVPDNDHTPLFWEEVANTFKGDPNVILRLQEEPHPAGNTAGLNAWQCWSKGDVQYAPSSAQAPPTPPMPTGNVSHCSESDTAGHAYQVVGMQSLVNIIRGSGASNVIQLPGVAYANMYSCSASGSPSTCGILDTTDGIRIQDTLSPAQLMADTDNYPDISQYCNTTSCYDATYAPVGQVMPIAGGEEGVIDASQPFPQYQAIMQWFKSHNVSTYAASWDTWSTLISDYNGTPKSPVGTWTFSFMTSGGTTTSPPANTSPPTITGTAQQGQTLTESHGTWTNSPTSYAYQWQRCDTSGANCTAISGATNQTYLVASGVASGDVGHTLRVQETATNAGGSAQATSAQTQTVTSAPPPPPPSGPMPHVSSGLPAYSNAGTSQCAGFYQNTLNGDTNSLLNNEDYTQKSGTCFAFQSTTAFPAWVAYNLSSIPALQQGQLKTLLSNFEDGYNYNYDFAQDNTGDVGSMRNYTIDVACQDPTATTPPTSWTNKLTVTGNTLRSRSDLIDMTGAGTTCNGNYNWIRINATAGNQWDHFQVKWNLWDASQNHDDSWMFYGDSITNVWNPQISNSWSGEPGTFAQQIHAWNSNYYPSFENGATGGKTAWGYTTYLTTHDGGLYQGGDSTPWLPKTAAHFVALGLGTNDCNGAGEGSQFPVYMGELVDEVLAADPSRVVILPHIQASPNLRSGTNTVQMWNGSTIASTQVTGNGLGPVCNQQIDQVVQQKQAQYGANHVMAGPDLWAATIIPSSQWGDGLHPFGSTQGIGLYNNAWVQWAEQNVYGTLVK